MYFRIDGKDKSTGKHRYVVIEAEDERSAWIRAEEMKLWPREATQVSPDYIAEQQRIAEEELKKELHPNEACSRCGDSVWQFESVSPNAKSITWVCSYCGKKEIVRADRQTLPSDQFHRDPIPKEVQREVWRRDQGRCVECGSGEKLEFDHIIPITKGGGNTVRNIRLLCERCNRKKGARIG